MVGVHFSTLNSMIILLWHVLPTDLIVQEEESNVLTTASIFGNANVSQEADNIMILQARDKINEFLQVGG